MANTNVNVTINDEFFMELGKLVSKYFGVTPDNVGKIDLTIPTGNGDDNNPTAPVAVKVNRVRQYGKKGLPENASCYKYEDAAEVLKRVLANHKGICEGGEGKFGCNKAAELIIHRYDPEGKLVDEALNILINANQHLADFGITRKKLEMVTRILALHQRRGRSQVKELLTELLTEQKISSLLVLAKETKLYTQRSDIDMLTMYTESRIAEKADGIRNQFTVAA